jgi:5,10-methylenetetrahydrofolate reductase
MVEFLSDKLIGENLMFDELIYKLQNDKYRTLETTPTFSASVNSILDSVGELQLHTLVDGFTTTDNPLAKLKYGAIFGAIKLQQKFGKPVIATVSMRDRNKIALQSDLLGANDFDIRAFLALTGDSAKISDQPNTAGVFEGDSSLLLDIVQCFNSGINYAGKPFKEVDRPKTIYPFAVVNSYAKKQKNLLKKMVKKIEHNSVGVITQPVYDIAQIKQLLALFEEAKGLSRCESPKAQLILGFFPLTRFRTAQFLSAHVPGIYVPDSWLDRLRKASLISEEEEEKVGLELSLSLYRDIMRIHPKIHIMTANKFDLAKTVLES